MIVSHVSLRSLDSGITISYCETMVTALILYLENYAMTMFFDGEAAP